MRVTAVRGVRLTAVAGERPATQVANAELPAELDVDDAWVRARTGIAARGLAAEGQGVAELAAAAGAKALAAAGLSGSEVDLLVLATCTPRVPVPATAPTVAARLGSGGAAFDLNAGCAGFCTALAMAADAVRGGSCERALVVGAERLSDWVDWTDRRTAVLFGDGAGAVVLEACDPGHDGVGPVVWGSDGGRAHLISTPEDTRTIRMDGPAVFRWAVPQVATVAREACARAGVEPRELAAFVPHQANLRIVEGAARALGLTAATVVADDVTTSGNTSAASVPLALARLVEAGRVAPGAPVLLVAFGAGLSWAGQVIRCP